MNRCMKSFLRSADDGGEWTSIDYSEHSQSGAVVFVDDDIQTEIPSTSSIPLMPSGRLPLSYSKAGNRENGAKTGLERFRVVWNCASLED